MKHNLNRNCEGDHILLHGEREIVYLMLKDIICIKANGNYSIFHMKNEKKFVSCNNLKHYEEMLCEKSFFRVNRSYIVNNAYIKYYHVETRELILTNALILFVSFRRKKQFVDTIFRNDEYIKIMTGS